MVTIFTDMFKEAITRSKGHRDNTVKIFTVLLEEVENWNNTIISEHAKEFEAKCSYFSDLLAAVFICYVNILARAIRKKNDEGKQLSVQLPSNSEFVHRCLWNAAQLFVTRFQFFREENPHIRYEKLYEVCSKAVHQTLDDLLPIQNILRTYIDSGSTFSIGDEPVGDLPIETEPEPEPEPEPQEPAPDPEVKEIPVTQPSLFDDAPEKTPVQQ